METRFFRLTWLPLHLFLHRSFLSAACGPFPGANLPPATVASKRGSRVWSSNYRWSFPPPVRSRAELLCGSPSLPLSPFAANQRFGMLLQIIGENAHGSRRAPEFLQRLVDLLELCRTRLNQV